jgi:elongation factor P
MIPVNDLRAGATYKENGALFEVISYDHVKLGRGPATIKIKARNLESGAITEKSFISGSRVEGAELVEKEVQFLYRQGDAFIFMDNETYEQFEIPESTIADSAPFLNDGLVVKIMLYEGKPLTLHLPIKMHMIIDDAPPGVKGNSTTNFWKDATVSTGLKVKVPLFIRVGDVIAVDTRTRTYIERVGKKS